MAATEASASINPATEATVAAEKLEKRNSSSEATAYEEGPEDNNKGSEEFNKEQQEAPALQRVPTTHFDPQGVRELSRRLTEISRTQSHLTIPDVTDEENFDFEQFLKRFQARSNADGVLERELGVLFEDLSVQGVGGGASMAPTMSDIVQLPLTIFRGIQAARHSTTKNIIEGFNGLVKPGEMLLVLGRPGAGCSTLLKTLTGYTDSFKGMEGTVSYDGLDATALEGELAYLPEDDIHFPLLTVGQTLHFAAASRTPSAAARLSGMSRSEYTDLLVDLYLTLFGLRQQVNTKVGNDVVRGVSGGQRKRVSIIEMLLTRAKVMAHDNSTRGLDSSTAVEYVRSLRLATDLQKTTTMASLYQCSEAIYELFDKVCLVSNGKMLYFGPSAQAPDYFKSIGFKQYFGQTSADFLVSITDPKARAIEEGYRPPLEDVGLVEAYHKSSIAAAERASREAYKKAWSEESMDRIQQSRNAEAVKRASKGYVTSYFQQIQLAVTRRFQLLRGDISTVIIQTAANIFQALIIGSVFYDITETTAGYFSRGGVIFFAILFNALTGLAEIPALYSQRPILVRQRRFRMAHPSTDAFAQSLTDLPVKGIVIICFDIILYWLTGLHADAGKFFVFLLFTLVTSLLMVCYFRMLAAITKVEAQASLLGGISILVLVITVGYAIPKPSMLGWYRWFTYVNPLTYGFEALMVNEFQGYNSPCASLVPSGAGYENVPLSSRSCSLEGYDSSTGLVRGITYLSQHFKYQYDHLWRNLGILFLYWIAFLAIQLTFTELQRDEAAAASVVLFRRSKRTKDIQRAAEKPDAAGDPEALIKDKAQNEAIGHDEEQTEAAGNVVTKPKEVLTWQNVNYTIPVKDGHRRLLADISGFVAPGKLTALMGESGAGKTTLLNVLAQRVTMGVVHGDIMVNHHDLPASFQRQCGYAQQQDLHLEQSTVREALQFSALLRQPASTPKQEKLDYVEEIIDLLEMRSFAEAIVGEPGAGLGVEQRKKLTIGVELAAKPSLLLFLDEPTSGLDSQSAWAIVQLLKKLAKHFSILCTIHQPSGELFNQFDRLLLLQRGGTVVYQGDLGHDCATVIGYFEEKSNSKMPKGSNPAEWILEVVGAGATAKKTQNYADVWSKSELSKKVQTDLDALHQEYSEPVHDAMSGQTYAAPWHKQLFELVKRGYISYWRNPTYLMAKFGLNIVGSLFIGFTFFQAPNSSSGLQTKLFAVFMALVLSNPLAQSIAPQFIKFRALFEVREQPSRIYHWIPFTTSMLLVEIPWNALASTIFFLCWQWTVGLTSQTERTGYMYAVFLLFSMYFASFMMALAAMSPNSEIASLLFAVLFSFVIIFCGVLQPPDLMPHFWGAWMPHLATFTYIVDSLLSTAIGGGKQIVCRSSEFAIVQPTSGTCQEFLGPYISASTGYVNNPDATSDCQYCQYRTGDEYLGTVGYAWSHRPQNVGYIIAYVAFNVALLFGLYYAFRVRGSGKKADYKKGAPPPADEGKKEEKEHV